MPGSVRRHTSGSSVGTREGDRRAGSARGLAEHVDVADDHRPARDQVERRPCLGQPADTGARQAVAALGGLVGVGRGPDGNELSLPAPACELACEDDGDVDLHPDRPAVAVVGRPVGTRLECTDVAERAAVGAARVRVQRPAEGHAGDLAEGRAAGILAVFRTRHLTTLEQAFWVVQRVHDVRPCRGRTDGRLFRRRRDVPSPRTRNGPPDTATLVRRRADPPAGCRAAAEPAFLPRRRSVAPPPGAGATAPLPPLRP